MVGVEGPFRTQLWNSHTITSILFKSLEVSHLVQPTCEGKSEFYSLKGRVSKNLWRDFNTTKGVVNKSSEHKTLWYDDAKTS